MCLKNKYRVVLAALLTTVLALSLGFQPWARGQDVAPSSVTRIDAVELHQALLDLSNPWTVMCIAAHPDDEDGTSLIVLRRKYGVHTVSLFSTFGEGGQNAIGPELYEEMGVIRARETMAAAEIQGSEPHFLGLKDFGFSKSADEAFRFWGHDEALRRMVLQFRTLRPDVIITNHGPTGGHGHHQATGRLELEAFDAAADAKRFPEQLKDGITTWQVQRLFVRAGFGGNANQAQPPDNAGVVTIDPNERDNMRGTTYAEQALLALQKHATQGPWPKTIAERLRNSADGKLPLTRYRLVREAKGAEPLTKDSHNFLDGLRLPENVAKQLTPPTIEGHTLTEFIDQPDRILDALLAASKSRLFDRSKATDADSNRFFLMTLRLNTALARASGISLTVRPRDEVLIPNTTATFLLTISNQGRREVSISGATFDPRNIHNDADNVKSPSHLAPKATVNLSVERKTPGTSQITVPNAAHLYDGTLFGKPILTFVRVDLGGTWFPLMAETHVDVAPPVEIADVRPSPFVITPGTAIKLQPMAIKLINHGNEPRAGELVFSTSASRFGAVENRAKFSLGRGETREITVPSSLAPQPASKGDPGSEDALSFSVTGRKDQGQSIQRKVPLVYADARVAPSLRIGYVRGFDYSLPNALAALGVESKELSVDEVKTADLQKYSTIIVDNRVYESQPELIAANQRLLDYAKDGGTLIVFYHKSNEWNPDPRRNRPQLAPYPLTLNDERVTDENAPITFIEPANPLLNVPNKLGPEDFVGWIQERGLYYPEEWDAHYHALLATNDPGEQPLRGGLLVADYGRGHYIYTSMVWYRQLRAGVPGGYRMLANMISYGRQ